MNTCMTLSCNICEQDTDCRIGYSNRTIQPLSFACPHCESVLGVILDISNAPLSDFKFTNCHRSNDQPLGPFNGKNPFVDLHLDFPVRFGEYVMGLTPFMMAMNDLKDSSYIKPDEIHQYMAFHSQRVDQLNHFHDKSEQIKQIIRLYGGKNKKLFRKRVGQFLGQEQGDSLKPQDINASLYSFISFVFLPFVNFGEIKYLVNEFENLTMRLHGTKFDSFLDKIISTGFLDTLQKDCLKLYPEIFNAEMPMRPVLFLDLTDQYEKQKFAGRVSTKEFHLYKDLYKDIVEVFARELVIVAGINNIIHRGDSDLFKEIDGGKLSSIDKYSSKTLTQKFKYLDDCWYPIDGRVIDAKLRNAIAHNNIEYNEVSQEITFYPDGGRIKASVGHKIYFLEFMKMVLDVFREMHSLHHLIKSLFYYEFLIRSKER